MIIDGDGQHRPEDARRIISRLGRVRPRRSARARSTTQATAARRRGQLRRSTGWPAISPAAHIPDLTSGFRGARREYLREFLHLLPNGFSTPTTTTLAFIKAGYNVGVRADRCTPARRHVEDPARPRRREVPDHHPEDRDALQPAPGLPADQHRVVRARTGIRVLDDRDAAARHELVGPADHARGHRLPRRPRLGTDLRAALRRASIAAACRSIPQSRDGGS